MSSITPNQLSQFHAVLNRLGLMPWKVDYVIDATAGRETSSKELSIDEARILISRLNREGDFLSCKPDEVQPITMPSVPAAHPFDKMRKKVIACFRELGYNKDEKADMTRIQATLIKHWGKRLNDYHKADLVKIIAVLDKEWIPHYLLKKGDSQ
jgi:hypothetical protein